MAEIELQHADLDREAREGIRDAEYQEPALPDPEKIAAGPYCAVNGFRFRVAGIQRRGLQLEPNLFNRVFAGSHPRFPAWMISAMAWTES